MEKIFAVRGMNDILPEQSDLWLTLEKTITDLFSSYGYKHIRTPIVEKTKTFCSAIGEVTDIVEKEMYSWQDLNGEHLSLRPEGTAGCVRAMIEHNLPREGVQKVFYSGQMFRRERPQKGRYRQFYQMGAEVFGADNAKVDAELISMSHNLWQKLGLKNINLEINTLGSAESRGEYRKILIKYFSEHKDILDEDSLRRLLTNPLRILDSKNKNMQDLIKQAPKIIDCLDDVSRQHFSTFKQYLDCLNIKYTINPNLVRGMDYYNSSVFEWTTKDLGSQGTICAGGRYDNLVAQMGGAATPAIGFAIGLERLILLLQEQNINILKSKQLSVYLIASSADAHLKSMQLANDLREALPGLIVYNDISLKSFKSQFKKADKADADYALILGDDEIKNNKISIKPLKSKDLQITINTNQTIQYLKEKNEKSSWSN